VINVAAFNWEIEISYGRLALELAGRLEQMGLHVNRIGQEGAHLVPCTGGVLLGYPSHFEHFGPLVASTGPRVAITMFEGTVLPPGWVETLNQMDAVIVPCRWNVEVFRAAGVTVPVYCVPLGISETFQYVERPLHRKPYTFLAIGDRAERKNWHVAMWAFVQAFGDRDDVRLIVKAQHFPVNVRNANIEIIRATYSEAQMAALYTRADCMVFPTSAEGFGFPPREFAATGGPVIATDFGGTADDLMLWGWPLRYTLGDAWTSDPEWRGMGQWAIPDQDHLAELMTRMVERQEHAQFMARIASRYVRSRYTWDRFARQVYGIYQEACDRHAHRATA
jgi:glycosyltransferase involved in cell wall biosynthesis